jgi:L,D-peptidoglycan transpeptidase YkuD (ErfK/YbiS/YcfS/YnhG family)
VAVRPTPARPSPLRRVLTVAFLVAVVIVALSGPSPTWLDPAAASAAGPAPQRVLMPPFSAEERAAPTEPVGRMPAVGLVPRNTAPATTATPSAPAVAPPAPTAAARTTTAAPSAEPAVAPVGTGLPLGLDPAGSQVVTVVAASSSSTTARLTAWELGAAGWTAVLGPVPARVGSAGVGRAGETSTRTPAGTFPLTEAFGRAGNPGTALPYRVVDGDDWWVSDTNSPRYNQYAQCTPGTCDFDEAAGEDLYAAGAVYDHAVVIDYNRGGTPGAGSAFFLHISNGAATAGCVAIDRGSLQTLLRWLDPAASPVIAIGVG